MRLETWFDASTTIALPATLRDAYGGDLGLAPGTVYANFVSSVDGVVAFEDDTPPSAISGKSEADRFVMGLLRAHADAVVVGAGTLAAEPDHLWTADFIYPALADDLAALRRDLGLSPRPLLVVMTRSGRVPAGARAFGVGALVVSSPDGAGRIGDSLPEETTVRVVDDPSPGAVLELLRADGHATILTEGGPNVMGSFLADRVLDEVFLTLSPKLAGRSADAPRRGLVEGFALAPDSLLDAELVSVKRETSHLFLRYRLRSGQAEP